MIAPAAVVAEARTWIGTPYRLYQARRGVAVDCMGLPMAVGQALGLLPAFLRNTPGADSEAMLAAILARHMRVLTPGEHGVPVHPIGAVVQVAMTPGGFARHLAITAWQDGRPSLIHALEGNRGVRETPVGRWCEGTSWPRVVAWYGFKGTSPWGAASWQP
jgi:cell wall-associated NlpC family hydrolase